MKKFINSLTFTVLLLGQLSHLVIGQTKSWFDMVSQIKPAVSNKAEVERVFNSAVIFKINKFEDSEDITYHTNTGQLTVTYSLGKCSEGANLYNLEKGTVINVLYFSDKMIKVSKLKLDLKQFDKKKEDDTDNWIYLSPESDAIYNLWKDKFLKGIIFSLSKTQQGQYSCKKQLNKFD